jgi:hypothetical protein
MTSHCSTKQFAVLIPFFAFTGFNVAMWASWFPRQMYPAKIGLVMPVFGAAEFIGGLTVGPALDKFGFTVVGVFAGAMQVGVR